MSRGWEKFFYVLTFPDQGSSFLSSRVYGIMHRLYHADTEQDPHSPEFPKSLFDMMWKTRLYYNDILNNRDSIAARFKKGLPNWAWMERLGDRWMVRLGWVAAYTVVYVVFAPSLWWFLLLPVHFLMIGESYHNIHHKFGAGPTSGASGGTNLTRLTRSFGS